MKKYERVKDTRYFNDIIAKGKYKKNKLFVIYIMKSEPEVKKFGIAVGKKVGNAVIRNKLKRQLRNIIDETKLLFPKGFDYIIIVKRNCLESSYKEMKEALTSLIETENI